VFRADYPVTRLLSEVPTTDAAIVMGHSRLITNGLADNQPVVRDGLAVLHNGIVVNDEAIWPSLGRSRQLQIDTEVIAALAADHLAQGRPVETIAQAVLQACRGVVACALFAAVSGSSPATVVAIGSILLPAMVKQGYPKKFGVGVIGTAGGLGILIPPSIVMVMYAVSTNSSIGALFMAGVMPGLVLTAMLMFTTWYRARSKGYPKEKRANWGERWTAFRESIRGLALIIVLMGGIYTGIFTPTEAAAMSAVNAFFVAVFVNTPDLIKFPDHFLNRCLVSRKCTVLPALLRNDCLVQWCKALAP
jgi:TRAP-type uncharacterized transport system fused permease subunit